MIKNNKLIQGASAFCLPRWNVMTSAVCLVLPFSVMAEVTPLETIEQRVARLEAALAEQENSSEEAASTSETQYSFGGYIKLDVLASHYSDGDRSLAAVGDDFLVASTIPIGGESGDSYVDMQAKHSRIWFKTARDTDVGVITTYIEMDFGINQIGDERISNSSVSRVRHAYLNWQYSKKSTLLAGQTWSTFFNVGSLPDTLDFVGAVGTLFERQAQLRWTQTLADGSAMMMSLENPSSGLYGQSGSDAGAGAYDNNTMPDIVFRYNQTSGDFNYSLSAVAREIAYKQNFNNSQAQAVAGEDKVYGYGFSFAGVWQLGVDDIRLQLNGGNALGRYLGLQSYRDGIITDNGDIKLIDSVGGYLAYRHYWAPKWRSSVVVSASSADNPSSVASTTAASYQSAHANLIYSPVSALSFGLEYIHARKTIERPVNGDDSGDVNRLQFSAKYVF